MQQASQQGAMSNVSGCMALVSAASGASNIMPCPERPWRSGHVQLVLDNEVTTMKREPPCGEHNNNAPATQPYPVGGKYSMILE